MSSWKWVIWQGTKIGYQDSKSCNGCMVTCPIDTKTLHENAVTYHDSDAQEQILSDTQRILVNSTENIVY